MESVEIELQPLAEGDIAFDIDEPAHASVDETAFESVEPAGEAMDIGGETQAAGEADPVEAEGEAEHEHASPEASADDDIPVLDQTDVIVDDPSAEHEGAPPLLTEPLEAPSDAQVAPLDEVDIDGHRVSASLYRIFLGEADETMAALDADLADWRTTPARAASEVAQRAMHSLKGRSEERRVGKECRSRGSPYP